VCPQVEKEGAEKWDGEPSKRTEAVCWWLSLPEPPGPEQVEKHTASDRVWHACILFYIAFALDLSPRQPDSALSRVESGQVEARTATRVC